MKSLFSIGDIGGAIWPFLRTIRKRRFDVVVDLQRHLNSGLISFFSGAPIRVGFNKADGKEFNWLFKSVHRYCGECNCKNFALHEVR